MDTENKGWVGQASLLSLTLVLAASGVVVAQDDEKRETFEAFAVNMSNFGPGRSTTVQITIDRWTTDEERNQLIETLVEKGSEELLKVLQKQEETGFVLGRGTSARANPFPSTRLHYAREWEIDGKRIIRLATDRPIGFREAVQNPRTMDYTFTLIELLLNEDGEGEGSLAAGVQITFDKDTNTFELEHYASEPIRLTSVRKRK